MDNDGGEIDWSGMANQSHWESWRTGGRFPRAIPIGSMYGIFTYIWLKLMVNVGRYTIHGTYGMGYDSKTAKMVLFFDIQSILVWS